MLAGIVLLGPAAMQAQKIRDPKASFLDLSTRRAFLQGTTDPRISSAIEHLRSCISLPFVVPPQGVMDIPKHYLQDSHGPTNPAEAAAARVYTEFETRVAAGMNRYVAGGNEQEAKCALSQLDAWAQARALLNYTRQDSPQAWYWVEWTLSSAGVSESVLVNDANLDPVTQRRVIAWLDAAARKDIGFERPDDTKNNHHYWRALAAASVGVVAADDSLFRFGLDTYKEAIKDLDFNGAFPREMARHERSLHYQIFAIDPLVMVAELASRQGVDLYSYTAHGRSLRDAIVFFGRALSDSSLIRAYTPEDQDAGFGSGDFAGVDFYVARFGSAGLPPSLLAGIAQPTSSTRLGGSATVLAAK